MRNKRVGMEREVGGGSVVFVHEFGKAAALMAAGHKLWAIEKYKNGKVSDFVFEDSPEVDCVMSHYERGELLLNARQHYEAMHDLRYRVEHAPVTEVIDF